MKNLIKMKDKELIKKMEELKETNRKMKFSAGGSQSKDSFQRRKNRREIARILTVLNNRENN